VAAAPRPQVGTPSEREAFHADEVLVKEILARMSGVRKASIAVALAEADLEKNLMLLDVLQQNLKDLERERAGDDGR
jgi:uncharacterized UPF0160 family protein